jgi:hypothetical protein
MTQKVCYAVSWFEKTWMLYPTVYRYTPTLVRILRMVGQHGKFLVQPSRTPASSLAVCALLFPQKFSIATTTTESRFILDHSKYHHDHDHNINKNKNNSNSNRQ